MLIREYSDAIDRHAVVALWTTVFGPQTGHNAPDFSIDQKLAAKDGLFFVAVETKVVGTVMAGYDGHRGWIYSLAVAPDCRKRGIGSALVQHVEQSLLHRGCAKLNLQVVAANSEVVTFYEKLGYTVEPRISMGKRLNT